MEKGKRSAMPEANARSFIPACKFARYLISRALYALPEVRGAAVRLETCKRGGSP